MKRWIYHGTHRIFAEAIREYGIPAIPDEVLEQGFEIRDSVGIRVVVDLGQPDVAIEARRHARAWAAYMIVRGMKKPEGMIVTAKIDESRISLGPGEVPRVTRLEPSEIALRGPIEFPEFGAVMLAGRRSAALSDARAAINDALDDFEKLTDRRITTRPRRRS